MRLNRNEINALLLITSSQSALRPLDINAHLGLRRGSVSRIITQLRDKGLVDRESEIVLAGPLQQIASKGSIMPTGLSLPASSR